jgi:3-oxoacyl-(acyl-carrier-protein) synthase
MTLYRSELEKLSHQDLPMQNLDPKFRRATPNMIASTLVCERVLKNCGLNDLKNIGFIYATHFGEMDSSTQYLSFLQKENFGRPILFQNSLHNSTLGFVSIALKITGPSLTISGGENMNESILNAADGLLTMCDHVLVCLSESIPEKYMPIYKSTFPKTIDSLNQSQAFLISNNSQTNFRPLNVGFKVL